MKILISTLIAAQLLTQTSFAGEPNDVVLKVLKQSSESATLFVDKDTYISNINGYGCAWPGLRILDMTAQFELNHNKLGRHFGSDESHLAIGIKNPNQQFCNSPVEDATAIFGKELVAGAELPIKVKRVLDSRKGERMDEKGKMVLMNLIHETITIKVNGRTIETTSEINLGK